MKLQLHACVLLDIFVRKRGYLFQKDSWIKTKEISINEEKQFWCRQNKLKPIEIYLEH